MSDVKQNPIELVLCDMDGTLLLPDHSISPRNLDRKSTRLNSSH